MGLGGGLTARGLCKAGLQLELSHQSVQAVFSLGSWPRAQGGIRDAQWGLLPAQGAQGPRLEKGTCARLITPVMDAWSTSKDTSHTAWSPGNGVVCVDLHFSGEKLRAFSDSRGVLHLQKINDPMLSGWEILSTIFLSSYSVPSTLYVFFYLLTPKHFSILYRRKQVQRG